MSCMNEQLVTTFVSFNRNFVKKQPERGERSLILFPSPQKKSLIIILFCFLFVLLHFGFGFN